MSESIELESLRNWASEAPSDSGGSSDLGPLQPASVFPIDDDLNRRIYLWEGQLWRLRVDAIVNSTNESMMDQNGLSGVIHQHAGPQLAEEIMQQEGCRTGECRVTRAYLLPCKKIIHTVGPRYNERYKTAAESALHYCYRNSMEEAVEHRLRYIPPSFKRPPIVPLFRDSASLAAPENDPTMRLLCDAFAVRLGFVAYIRRRRPIHAKRSVRMSSQ